MREEVIWTDLTPREIGEDLTEKDLYVCEQVIRQLLDDEGYRRRQIQKYLDMGAHADRNAQFENIARIKRDYLDSPDPILSIDTKKRELLGTFYRDGRVYTRQGLLAFDHDFPSYADGVVIPYGLYDLKRNFGYLSVGTSHDTTEFACDSIAWWWEDYGRALYPEPIRSACCATAAAATAPTSTCSRRTSRSWPIGWDGRSAWRTTRRTARSTTRSSAGCSRT